jgi:hypothetical protein
VEGRVYNNQNRTNKQPIGRALTMQSYRELALSKDRVRYDDVAMRERLEFLVSSGGETDESDELNQVRRRTVKLIEKRNL